MKAKTFVDALIYLCRRPIDPAQDVIIHYRRPEASVEDIQHDIARVTLIPQDASHPVTPPSSRPVDRSIHSTQAMVPRAGMPTPTTPRRQGKDLFIIPLYL